MAIRNPFSRLKITKESDSDDEQQSISQKPTSEQTTVQLSEEYKKKIKIRPEERKRLEEVLNKGQESNLNNKNEETNDNEGFSQVKKRKTIQKEGQIGDLLKAEFYASSNRYENKENHSERSNYQIGRGGKRIYDKQSGTGRGKEISKQGAGSKTTWGNEEELAKKEAYGEQTEDYYYNYYEYKFF